MSTTSKTTKERDEYRNQSRQYLLSATQYHYNQPEILFLLSYLCYKNNEYSKAISAISSIPDTIRNGSITLRNVQLLKAQLLQGNFQSSEDLSRARLLYENIIHVCASNGMSYSPFIWNNIAILRLTNKKEEARIALEEIIKYTCNDSSIAYKEDVLLFLSEEEKNRYLSNNMNVTIAYNYGVFLQHFDRLDESIQVMRMINQAIPYYYECRLHLARLSIMKKEEEYGIKELRSLCEELDSQLRDGFLKDSSTLLTYVTNVYADSLSILTNEFLKHRDYKQAIQLLTQSYLAKSKIHDLYINLQLANVYIHISSHGTDTQQYFRRAVEMYQKALQKYPRNIYVANGCGVILQKTAKTQAALHIFKKIRENVLDFKNSCFNMAQVQLLNEKYIDAICLFEKVLSEEEDVELYVLLALSQMNSGLFDRAIENLKKAQNLDRNNGYLLFNLAVCNEKKAGAIMNRVAYYHSSPMNPFTKTYPCCNGAKDSKGCKVRSQRSKGEMDQVAVALEFALSAFKDVIEKYGKIGIEGHADQHLLNCKELWGQRDYHIQIDREQENDLEKEDRTNAEMLLLLEKKRGEEVRRELEKKEKEEMIARIVEEEKKKLDESMTKIAEMGRMNPVPTSKKKNTSQKAKRVTSGGGGGGKRRNQKTDIFIEDSDDDTDDHGEESSDEDIRQRTRHVFGEDSEEEKEEVEKKKRVKAIESDEEDVHEEKKPKLNDTVEEEVNKMFSDDSEEVEKKEGDEKMEEIDRMFDDEEDSEDIVKQDIPLENE